MKNKKQNKKPAFVKRIEKKLLTPMLLSPMGELQNKNHSQEVKDKESLSNKNVTYSPDNKNHSLKSTISDRKEKRQSLESSKRKIDTPARIHNSEQGCDSSSADSLSETKRPVISMKEHIEILNKAQDYQYKEGFEFGYDTGYDDGYDKGFRKCLDDIRNGRLRLKEKQNGK